MPTLTAEIQSSSAPPVQIPQSSSSQTQQSSQTPTTSNTANSKLKSVVVVPVKAAKGEEQQQKPKEQQQQKKKPKANDNVGLLPTLESHWKYQRRNQPTTAAKGEGNLEVDPALAANCRKTQPAAAKSQYACCPAAATASCRTSGPAAFKSMCLLSYICTASDPVQHCGTRKPSAAERRKIVDAQHVNRRNQAYYPKP
jgi:hypothetical protein